MAILLSLIVLSAAEQPHLPYVDSVIKHFYEKPFILDDVEFPDKGDILWIKYDVTQDGRDDILISARNLLTGDWEWLAWDVYAGDADGRFRSPMFGVVFDPNYLLVVTDDAGTSQLATERHLSAYESGVTLLKIENDRPSSNVQLRTIASDSPEDQAWIEEHRSKAAGLINVVPAAELAKKYPPAGGASDGSAGEMPPALAPVALDEPPVPTSDPLQPVPVPAEPPLISEKEDAEATPASEVEERQHGGESKSRLFIGLTILLALFALIGLLRRRAR